MLPGLSGSREPSKLWPMNRRQSPSLVLPSEAVNNTRCHLNPINREGERGLTALVDLQDARRRNRLDSWPESHRLTDAITAEAWDVGLVADRRWLGEGLLFDKLAAIIHRRAFKAIVAGGQPADIYAIFIALRDREVGRSRGW